MRKLSLQVTILLASVILGGFYFASEVYKQKSIEKQREANISNDKTIASYKKCENEINEKFNAVDRLVKSQNDITTEQAQTIARRAGIIDDNNYVIDKDILIEQCLKN